MAKSDFKRANKITFQFAPIPTEVLRSLEWYEMPPNACKLAMALVGQYTGKNNGRLCPSWEVMQFCGFRSEHTLIAAKRALLECSFVVHTRMGKKPRTADWIAFTWWKLDWEKSMDIEARGFPYLNFVTAVPLPAPHGKTIRDLQKVQAGSAKQAPGPAVFAGREHAEEVS